METVEQVVEMSGAMLEQGFSDNLLPGRVNCLTRMVKILATQIQKSSPIKVRMKDWRDGVVLSTRDAQETLIAMEEDAATTGICSPSRKLVEILQVVIAEIQQIKGIHIPYPSGNAVGVNAVYGKTAAQQTVRDIVDFLRQQRDLDPGDSDFMKGHKATLRKIQIILDNNGYKEED